MDLNNIVTLPWAIQLDENVLVEKSIGDILREVRVTHGNGHGESRTF